MSNISLKGLAWGHRRATGPLDPLGSAFRASGHEVDIIWTVRPLSDFEHQPLAEIARQYDLLILDHPFCGDITESGALLPLEAELPELLGPNADGLYVGPSLASYRFRGHVWAAPIDAAASHAAYRPDLLDKVDAAVPTSWDETIVLGKRLRRAGLWLATPAVSPHAYCTVASLMANLGKPLKTDPDQAFGFDPQAMATALEALDEVLSLSPPETLDWNAIAIEEAMVARDDVAFTPSVFGYATYGEADMRRPLCFANFCGIAPPYAVGSMLGGTGLAVSAASANREAAVAFVRFSLSREAQDRIIPEHHGQPARASSWEDPANNARFGGFYSAVRQSIETAWTRPRRPGYIRFQKEAGSLIEAYCRRDLSRRATIDQVAKAGRAIFGQRTRADAPANA